MTENRISNSFAIAFRPSRALLKPILQWLGPLVYDLKLPGHFQLMIVFCHSTHIGERKISTG